MPLLLSFAWAAAAPWTVAVYMAADNGLNDQAYVDMAEMMRVGSTAGVNVVVQVDNAAWDSNPGCRRYFIRDGGRELLEDLGDVDMADSLTLGGFGRFVRERYPAKQYCLVLWDHGSGWSEGYGPSRAMFIDESRGHMMGVAGGELAAAVSGFRREVGKRVEVLAFDACLMGMVEVAGEVRDDCNYVLASEGTVVWGGFAYDRLLEALAQPGTVKERLGQMCSDYVADYPGQYVCMSALDMRQLDRALPVLADYLAGPQASIQELRAARARVQTFAPVLSRPPGRTDDQVDLVHFFQLVPGADSLARTLARVVAANAAPEGLPDAQGLAAWFPDNYLAFKNAARSYGKLAFADTAPWTGFLNSYFGMDDVKPTQPVPAEPRPGGRGDIRLSWSRSQDNAPVTYEVYEFAAPVEIFADDGEDLASWTAAGWTLSDGQARSGDSSFHSGAGPNIDHRLEISAPLALPGGGVLSVYAWHATEEAWDSVFGMVRDICYVEWSPDRATWQPLDSLYGSAREWRELRYLLPAAQSLYLRFRYVTNDRNNGLGVFLDDITVTGFDTLRCALTTADTFAHPFNLPRDTSGYYYFLTATDSFGNVSMASPFSSVVKVQRWAEPCTRPAPFSGPCKLVLDFPAGETPDVRIYALSGTLVWESRDVATQNLDWDGCNKAGKPLADGLYLVSLRGKDFHTLGKIARVTR